VDRLLSCLTEVERETLLRVLPKLTRQALDMLHEDDAQAGEALAWSEIA
jgi:hypothetical protein